MSDVSCPSCGHERLSMTRIGERFHYAGVRLRQRLGLPLLTPVCRQAENVNPAGQQENCRCPHIFHST